MLLVWISSLGNVFSSSDGWILHFIPANWFFDLTLFLSMELWWQFVLYKIIFSITIVASSRQELSARKDDREGERERVQQELTTSKSICKWQCIQAADFGKQKSDSGKIPKSKSIYMHYTHLYIYLFIEVI